MTEKIIVKINPIVKDLAGKYLENRRKNIEDASGLIKSEDWKGLWAIGHKLRGVGQIYGFNKISEIGLKLEEAAEKKDQIKSEELCLELTEYLNNVEVV
jgi:hypothetical protein